MSGTASGQIHIWDAPTGAFIFGTAARHPNDTGLSAMGTSENRGNGADRNAEIGGTGPTFAAATAAAAAAPASGGATASSIIEKELRLYTACEEGFVKTWKVGEDTHCDKGCFLVVFPVEEPLSRRRGSGMKSGTSETGRWEKPLPLFCKCVLFLQ